MAKKTKHPKGKTRSAVRPPTAPLPGLLRAALIAVGCGAALLFPLCAILLTTPDPCACALTAASLIPLPISVLCGVLSAKNTTLGGLPSGLLGGGIFCLLLFALGAVIPACDTANIAPLLNAPIRAGLCVLLSALGGYCTTHRKPKTKRRYS